MSGAYAPGANIIGVQKCDIVELPQKVKQGVHTRHGDGACKGDRGGVAVVGGTTKLRTKLLWANL